MTLLSSITIHKTDWVWISAGLLAVMLILKVQVPYEVLDFHKPFLTSLNLV